MFIIGTAGSGKSMLTSSYGNWLRTEKQNVALANFDPGALHLPYTPDLDVRDFISIENIMDEYGLGPNGALIMAADLIADMSEKLGEELDLISPDIVLVDTPGQMELFAFRASGPYIARELTREPKAIVYLFDSVFSANPLNYVSNMFLSAAIHTRFFLPQIHVLSKCDLLPEKEVDNILDWSESTAALENAIHERSEDETRRLLSYNLMEAMHQLELNFAMIPVSSRTNEGIVELSAFVERIFKGGEKITY
ncbi:MAG: ATP/GTP-binding protein [Candidatus Bathyarchaeia archaeon]